MYKERDPHVMTRAQLIEEVRGLRAAQSLKESFTKATGQEHGMIAEGIGVSMLVNHQTCEPFVILEIGELKGILSSKAAKEFASGVIHKAELAEMVAAISKLLIHKHGMSADMLDNLIGDLVDIRNQEDGKRNDEDTGFSPFTGPSTN